MDYYYKYILEKEKINNEKNTLNNLKKELKEIKKNKINLFNKIKLKKFKSKIKIVENKLNKKINNNKSTNIINIIKILFLSSTGIASYRIFDVFNDIKKFETNFPEDNRNPRNRREYAKYKAILNVLENRLKDKLKLSVSLNKISVNELKIILVTSGLFSGTVALMLARWIYNSRKIYNRANIDLKNLIKLKKEFIKYTSKENKIKHIKILKTIVKKLKQKINKNMMMFPFFGGYTDYYNMTDDELNNMGMELLDEIKDIAIKYKNIIDKFHWFKKFTQIIRL